MRCCALTRAPAPVEAALLCLARCCANPALQALLLQRGALGHVLPLLLAFDASQLREDQDAQRQGLAPPAPGPDDAAAVLRLPLVRANAQVRAMLGRDRALGVLLFECQVVAAWPALPSLPAGTLSLL